MLRYAPEHNWIAYEEALKTHPVLSKMAISGIVYALGDWIAQVSIMFSSLFSSYNICLGSYDHFCLQISLSVMKGSPCLSLIERVCLGPASLDSHSMDHFPITITNSVRYGACGLN